MATYYVRTDGNDGNTGLGSGTGQAWATVGKALGATGITGGDTVYIAPGTYREVVTIGGTYSSATYIYGNPTASQFVGVTAGEVRITPSGSDNAVSTSYALTATSKNNLNFKDLIIGGMSAVTCTNLTIEKCLFFSTSDSTPSFKFTSNSSATNWNTLVKQSIFIGTIYGVMYAYRNGGVAQNVGFAMNDCFATGQSAIFLTDEGTGYGPYVVSGINVYNCVLIGYVPFRTLQTHIPATGNTLVINNSLVYSTGTYAFQSNTNIAVTENYNRIYGINTRQNVSQGANTTVASWPGLEFGQSLLQGFGPIQIFGNTFNSPNATAGTASGAPAVDMYGQSWNVTPDIGVAIYRTIGGVGAYLPAAQAAGTITIAPGSTSQSIELYLGVTGLTASTSGLSARYNRTRTASVSIPLVARTIAQAWTSGGFAEVDATNMPGVYRLDLPDAALAAGADDVTVVVRGASGTNGAVMTIKLSSGGLTSAQTASAVWDASPAGYNDATTFGGVVNQIDATVTGTSTLVQDIPSNVWQEQTDDHTTHGTYGYNILRADAPSKEGLVTLHQSGGISRIDADIHAVVNDTAAAAELKGALLHNGTDYISADLLTPVTSAQTVRIGPFAVRTDAGGADGALDLNQSTAGAVVVQLTDAQGTGIDQTSATVQAKVYNVAGGLVATYTCTPAYAVNGFVSIPMTTAVTGTAGSYIINLWSTVGSTVIIYGPLQLRVRAI